MENTRAKLKIRGLPFVRHEEFAGPQPSVMQSSVGEVGGTSAPENGGSNGSSHGQMFLSFLSRKIDAQLGRRSRLVSRNPGIVSGNGGEVVIAGVADARPTQNTEMVGDGGNGYTSVGLGNFGSNTPAELVIKHPGPAPASIARLQEVNVSLEPVGSRAQGDTLGLGVNSGISSRGPRERLALMYVQRVGVMNGAEGDACWHGGEANIPSALEALPGILEVAHSTSQALGKPGVAQIFSSGVNIANTGLDGIDTLSETYLQPLKLFSGVVNTISGLHPYAKMALVALSWPAQVIISQANRDVAIVVLVAKICDIYAFIMEDKNLYQLAAMQPLLKSMSDQLFDCAQFIVNYSETKNFWIRAGKNIIQETDAAIAQYNDALDGLMKSFSDKAVSDRVVGNIVIIIDALDECHDEGRKKILHILASIPVDHLMNLRILLSSRSLVDIWDALGNTGHVKIESLDTISVDSAKSDVLCYITRKLQNLRPPLREEELEQLATKSDGLFEWARMASDLIFLWSRCNIVG
ncbi:hypothetical protein ID866_5978 [Astraeus odoratus]|nr:hypothetical protein ID866_5978 [Astraeus odoratus]